MTREEMLARISSPELTAWWALFEVEADEAEHHRDVIESGDGQVIVHGLDDDEDEEDRDDGDGE
jgi:hypothetical protein